MLFVGQVDFMLVALASLSPFTLPLLLAKPQVAIVVLPWVMLHMTRQGWLQAGITTILFVGICLAIRPTWVAEYLSAAPAASNYLIRSSSLAYLLPNGDIRLIGTVILAVFGVALSLRARSRKHSLAIMQLFQPLSNIYSPSVLAEWIGPREVLLSWLPVFLFGGNIHAGMPLFIIPLSILFTKANLIPIRLKRVNPASQADSD